MKNIYNYLCKQLWEKIDDIRNGEKINKDYIIELCDLISICRNEIEKQGEI